MELVGERERGSPRGGARRERGRDRFSDRLWVQFVTEMRAVTQQPLVETTVERDHRRFVGHDVDLTSTFLPTYFPVRDSINGLP